MSRLTIELSRDGHKNVVYIVSGRKIPNGKPIQITDKSAMLPKEPEGLRLDSIEFAIESGTKIILGWHDDEYLLPLEGRGKLDFQWFDGIQGDDIHMTVTGEGVVFIVLDLSKIGV